MSKLIEEIIKPFLTEMPAPKITKIIGVYGGRFQPFGPHHLKTYKWLSKRVDDAYITTSNIKKPPRHPMNFKAVYGTVQNKWISDGKRYKHAWVEDGNLVKDWQTNDPKGPRSSKYAGKGWPKREFYKVWNVKNEKKYTPQEVADNFRKTKSIMGWDWK